MANNRMPYVAIIGGFWHLKPEEADAAKETAREIGAALATAELGLVVYFSHEKCLEPYVVTGYVANLPVNAAKGSIRMRFAESQKLEVRFAEQSTHPEFFEPILFPGDEWEAPFYRSLVDAEGVDAVLLLAGETSTLIAGQIALARGLPLLAVDKFRGSAPVIRRELALRSQNYPSSSTHTVIQGVTWLRDICRERVKHREDASRREEKYKKAISQKNRIIWAACVFVLLLVSIFYGLAMTPPPNYYSGLMFFGLIAAGATGALVRSLIGGVEENAPSKSLFLGGVAGFVVGLAYLIPQWVGAPGVLAPSATIVGATDKIQFVSSVLIAVSAGVGFDTVFTRMKKQAEEQAIGPPGP